MARSFIVSMFISISLFNAGSAAGSGAVSQSGDLEVNFFSATAGRDCDSSTPSGKYTVRNGSRGLLYPDCSYNSGSHGDALRFKFIDTQGSERCLGRMEIGMATFDSQLAVKTIWHIDGTVSGQKCSVAGQRFIVENMREIR